MKLQKAPHFNLYLLLVGFSIRFLFSPFTRDPWDMNTWLSVGSAIFSGKNPYALSSNALVYPPFWGLFCAISYLPYSLTSNLSVFYLAIKLPIIVADILISIIIRKFVQTKTQDPTKAQKAMIFYLFNPVTIIFSSMWGMFDAIPALFTLLSVLYLSKGEYSKSGIALGVGIGFKGFFPALLLPFFIYYVWRRDQKTIKSLAYVAYSVFVPILISIPFLVTSPNSYTASLLYQVGKIPQNLTYWFSLRLFSATIGVPSDIMVSLGSFAFLFSFPLLYIFVVQRSGQWAREMKPDNASFLIKASLLVLFAFFITSSTVSEQYLIWAIPLLILYLSNFDKSLKPYFYSLSIIDAVFVALNVGPRFFTPIVEMPSWWINFQYSWPSLLLMAIIAIFFSGICISLLTKMVKKDNTPK
jgi:Gpi18-like mannosyltransferase